MQAFSWNDASPETVVSELREGISRLGTLPQGYRDQFVQYVQDEPTISKLFQKTHA